MTEILQILKDSEHSDVKHVHELTTSQLLELVELVEEQQNENIKDIYREYTGSKEATLPWIDKAPKVSEKVKKKLKWSK